MAKQNKTPAVKLHAKRKLAAERGSIRIGKLTADECEAIRLRDKIYKSWLRWGQDTYTISHELNVPVDKIEEIVKTFAKNKNTDVAWMISQEILQEINKGHQARLQHIKEAILALKPHLVETLSVCCVAPTFQVAGASHCAVCGKLCHVSEKVNDDNMQRYHDWIEQWQALDTKLVASIAALGFAKPNSPLASLVMNALHLQQKIEINPTPSTEEKKDREVVDMQITAELQREMANMAPQELENAIKVFEACFGKQVPVAQFSSEPMEVPKTATFDVSDILSEMETEGAHEDEQRD